MATAKQFSDMQQHWAEACVRRLASLNQLKGYPDNTFRPEAKVTRAEFSVFMLNGFPNLPFIFPDPQPTANFKDLPRQHWAYQVLQTAYRKGIYVGYPDNTIRPDKTITREEAIATIANLVEKVEKMQAYDSFQPDPDQYDDIFKQFSLDASQLSSWSKTAIATAAANFLVVDYPSGKQLRPTQAMTRAEVAASLCQAQRLDGLVPIEAVAGNQHFDWSPELKKLQRAKTEGQWCWFDRKREVAVIAALPKETIEVLEEPVENRALIMVKAAPGQSRYDHLYGYLDENGKVAIAPQFGVAYNFSEGCAAVLENAETHKYGFIDPQGKWVIPAQFDEAKSFSEGLAAVRVDSQWGFIDRMGAWAVSLQPYEVESFSAGLARIAINEYPSRYGFIDRTGKQVIAPEFKEVTSFSEGLAWVGGEQGNPLSQSGYIDHTGKWALSFPPNAMGSLFSEGLASFSMGDGMVGVIDRRGKFVIPPRPQVYDGWTSAYINTVQYTVGRFVAGVATARVGKQIGFINRKGEFIIPPKYAEANSARDGYALVRYGGVWGTALGGYDGSAVPLSRTTRRGGRYEYIKIPKQSALI